jgi:hypothetical protein
LCLISCNGEKMILKKIVKPFRKKPPGMPSESYKTLTEAIKNTPEYTTKEVAIVKAGNKYYNASETRGASITKINTKILERAYKYNKSKIVHTHISGLLKELPASQDIAQLFFQHLKYNKSFTAISNIDKNTGEISGTVAISLTSKSKKFIESNFPKKINKLSGNNIEIYTKNLLKILRAERKRAELKATAIANSKKGNNKVFIETYNTELKKIMFDYFQKTLGLNIKFVPNTRNGYRFNKERMAFEKI